MSLIDLEHGLNLADSRVLNVIVWDKGVMPSDSCSSKADQH